MCAVRVGAKDPSDDRQAGWGAGEHEEEEGEGGGRALLYITYEVGPSETGRLSAAMGRLNKRIQRGAGQERERESPGSGKVRKNFEKDPRASWQVRTTQCSTLLQAGEAAPKWQVMPHTTQSPCSTRAAIGES